MRKILFLIFMLAAAVRVGSQNYWNPDSTAFNYLSRGASLQQWVPTAGTTVTIDSMPFRNVRRSIKWTIPPNSGTALLDLKLVDLDLRERVLYTRCCRNNHAASLLAKIIVGPSRGFRMSDPVYYNNAGRHLPVEQWHRRGRFSSSSPFGGAKAAELAHAKSIRFQAENAAVEQILWIEEIKYTRPAGPACIIHFNHYRRTADSLLTPWLLARGYPANLDFTFEYARDELVENRGNSGLITKYVGLDRLAALKQQYGWSTTHHGVFYAFLPTLTLDDRTRLYALAPFQQAGFETQWCFSVPRDEITPEIFAEIQALERFFSVRTQGMGKPPNELPLDEPIQLRFYRPTSASASPKASGDPQTLTQMKAEVDSYFKRKGLLILDFGAIVDAPAPNFTGSEITMLEEAQALIQYADSLGFQFLTFEKLFTPDLNYQPGVSINPDYMQAVRERKNILPVLQNDLARTNDSLRLVSAGSPQHGQIEIAEDRKSASYTPTPRFIGEDRFYYVATNGLQADTAWVFVTVVNSLGVDHPGLPVTFALQQNYPNPFSEETTLAYELSQPAFVEIKVYAMNGQEVATLISGMQTVGRQRVGFVASGLAAGVYFYRARVNGRTIVTQKMIYLKNRLRVN